MAQNYEILGYQPYFASHTMAASSRAFIYLQLGGTKELWALNFVADGNSIPPPNLSAKQASFSSKDFGTVLDLLRNEGPVWLALEPGHAAIRTRMMEPVGEGDG